jgi:FkbM family methyltransferase
MTAEAQLRSKPPGRSSPVVWLINNVPGPLAGAARRNRVVAKSLGPLVNRLVPASETAVVVRSGPAKGLTIVIRPREEKFYWAGTVEPGVQEALLADLHEGARFWDVGAHCGFFTSLASRLVGSQGQVVSFEPCDENRARLTETVHLNDAGNVQIVPWALGASSGTATMREGETSTTWSTIPAEGSNGKAVEVEQRTLDECARELEPPDLIKVDVEGAELEVLEGAKELIGSVTPDLIIEFHSPDALRAAREILGAYSLRQVGGLQWVASPRFKAAGARPAPESAERDQRRPGLVRAIDHVPASVVRGVGRLGPVKTGISRLVGRLVPEREMPVVVRSGPAKGLTVVIHPREEKFYWAGTHEPGVQDALVDQLRRGMSFWDVGAHCGFFSSLASRLVGRDGQVVCFEPCDENRARLTETVRLNDAGNARIVPWALGASRGEALLQELDTSQTSMKWGKVHDDPEGKAIRVPQRTLDECARELPPPDLIKVDVEGAELEVLEGATELIRSRRPAMIIEFHDEVALRRGEQMLQGYSKSQLGRTQWLLSSR